MIGTILVSFVALLTLIYCVTMVVVCFQANNVEVVDMAHYLAVLESRNIAVRTGFVSFLIFVICILWLGI